MRHPVFETSATAILTCMLLAACAQAVTPAPTATPRPTTTRTPTAPAATATQRPDPTATPSFIPTRTPYVDEFATENCFVQIPFMPGMTRTSDVLFRWGQPVSKSASGDREDWVFELAGHPLLTFDNQILETAYLHLKDCSLEKIISRLGPPEKVEITFFSSCTGGAPLFIDQDFHFASRGFAYSRSCDETQDCFTFRKSDIVYGKEFYPRNRIIEELVGFNTYSYLYQWHGYDVNLEAIENKMPDISLLTPVQVTP